MATVHAPSEGTWLTLGEVASLLRLDRKTVSRHAGDLGAVRIGRSLRFPPIEGPTLDFSVRGPQPDHERIR